MTALDTEWAIDDGPSIWPKPIGRVQQLALLGHTIQI